VGLLLSRQSASSSISPSVSALEDTAKDREYIVRKILSTRLFDGPAPPTPTETAEEDGLKERQKSLAWRASVKDIEGEVLCGTHLVRPWEILALY
jgi:hypothetical protein